MKHLNRLGLFCVMTAALAMTVPGTAHAAREHQDLIQADGGFGFSWAHSLGAYGIHGVGGTKVFLMDQLALGLRIDAGVQVGIGVDTSGDNSQVDTTLGINVAALFNVEYYFGAEGFRPYVALGMGDYLMTLQAISAGGPGVPSVYQGVGHHFGLQPQLGLDFGGGTRLAVTYSYILNGDMIIEQTVGEPIKTSRNYLGIELTFKSWGFTPKAK